MLRSPVSRFLLIASLLSGCATPYENTARRSWELMKSGKSDEALSLYSKEVTSDKEKLLRLMDEGVLLRTAERFEESNQKFFAAAKIIEMNGYLSLGEQSLTLLTNEKQTTYQGEDFEKVLVHLYLGLNYLSLKDTENAVVETRKVNEIIFKMISEAKRPYELNAFARYLGGVLFENEGDENDALVSYRNTAKIDPSLESRWPTLQIDLLRMFQKNGMDSELDEYKKKSTKENWERAKKTLQEKAGSVLLLLESGKSPEKFSSRETHTSQGKGGSVVEVLVPVAYYKKRYTQIHSAVLKIQKQSETSVVLNDIEKTAIQQLKDRMGRAIAKALLTAGVKAGVATAVGKATNSKEIGLLTGIALFLASEADTRSWLLLPQDLQIAKIFLPAGNYSASIDYVNANGAIIKTENIPKVEVKAGKATFIQRRTFE